MVRDGLTTPRKAVPLSEAANEDRDLICPGGDLSHKTAEIVAYCLMPNHYHLLIRLCGADLSAAMQKVMVSYAKAFNKQCTRVGPLFQGPFRAIHVDRDEYLLHLSGYIHLSPVAAGLVSRAADWAYSSYPEYIGLRRGTLPKPAVILNLIGSAEAYGAFVEEGGADSRGPDQSSARRRRPHRITDRTEDA